MKKIFFIGVAVAVMATAISSCKRHSAWSISGEVAGADSRALVVEAFNNGLWYVVDSLTTNSDGSFKYTADAPAEYPEVMRLGMDGRYIYFPIDSIDNVTVVTDTTGFGTSYRLDGTMQARNLQTIDSIINSSVALRGALATAQDDSLKRNLFALAYEDPSIMSVYYLINKSVGNYPLFDVSNSVDRRLYGAVAQRFVNERPSDPRAEYLAGLYRRARLDNGDVQPTAVEATEVSLLEIERYDANGKLHSLAELAGKGGVTVLSFTAYGLQSSPAYSAILNSVYDKYHDRGLEIFQIGFDEDESTWKENARNLPWIAVWNSTTDGNRALIDYNVGALPMTFVIDRTGTIRERIADPSELDKAIQKYL